MKSDSTLCLGIQLILILCRHGCRLSSYALQGPLLLLLNEHILDLFFVEREVAIELLNVVHIVLEMTTCCIMPIANLTHKSGENWTEFPCKTFVCPQNKFASNKYASVPTTIT